VTCADGSAPEADLVIIGVGITPNTELAAAAGLETEDGIRVDEHARTSDPDIVAAGDCTNHPNAKLGRRVRLECVQNALDQARTAAATLCGKTRIYAEVPRFWSDQYDLRLQIVGLADGHDTVVTRATPGQPNLSVFYLVGDRLIAVESTNRPKDFALSRRLIADQASVDLGRLSDDTIPLAEAILS
jgi:3-phenylpropionate/trans-cinnamate dioxygenase ferredoxin reductase subunit